MRIIRALISNLITLAVVIANFYYTKPDPRVLLFSFAMLCIFRYVLIELLYDLYKVIQSETFHSALKTMVQPIPENINYDPKAGLPNALAYIILIILLFVFPFVFMHLENGDFVLSWLVFVHQIKAALIITMIYLLKDLFFKGTCMDFSKPKDINFYSNSGNILVLWALAFFGGWLLPMGQKIGTPWLLVGILLVFKHFMDFLSDVFWGPK